MRTTIELPDNVHHWLVEEASKKRMKGFSAIIVQALREYFGSKSRTGEEKREDRIRKLRGSLSKADYNAEIRRIEEGRANWRA